MTHMSGMAEVKDNGKRWYIWGIQKMRYETLTKTWMMNQLSIVIKGRIPTWTRQKSLIGKDKSKESINGTLTTDESDIHVL